MNDVVARFERERDFGDVDMAAIAHARATPLRVVNRNHADFCRRNDHAQGDIHVDDVHDAFFQGTNIAMPPGVVVGDFARLACAGVSVGSASSLSSGAESRISCMGSELSTQKSFHVLACAGNSAPKTTV